MGRPAQLGPCVSDTSYWPVPALVSWLHREPRAFTILQSTYASIKTGSSQVTRSRDVSLYARPPGHFTYSTIRTRLRLRLTSERSLIWSRIISGPNGVSSVGDIWRLPGFLSLSLMSRMARFIIPLTRTSGRDNGFWPMFRSNISPSCGWPSRKWAEFLADDSLRSFVSRWVQLIASVYDILLSFFLVGTQATCRRLRAMERTIWVIFSYLF